MSGFVEWPGAILGVCLVAFGLWQFGVRDEFILVAVALAVGAPLGGLAERALGERLWGDRPKAKRESASRDLD